MSGPISRAVMFVVNSRQDEQRHQAMAQVTLVLCSVVIQLQPTIETRKVLINEPLNLYNRLPHVMANKPLILYCTLP